MRYPRKREGEGGKDTREREREIYQSKREIPREGKRGKKRTGKQK